MLDFDFHTKPNIKAAPLKLDLDKHPIAIPCPKYGKQLKENIGRLKRDKYITRTVCGRFAVGMDQLRRIEDAINKKWAKFPSQITLKL